MDEQLILQQSKVLTLNYLKKIGASVEDSHGLYQIDIPVEYENVFGGLKKRITFDLDVAAIHSCELVVPGSNFLSIILSEIRKQAPVIGGHLVKQAKSPSEYLDRLSTHKCQIVFDGSQDNLKIAIRFYFFITVKSIKNASMLRWVDIDLQTQQILDLPMNIEFDQSLGKIKYEKDDQRIDHCYVEATRILEKEIEPLAIKYVELTKSNLERDKISLDQVFEKRIKEINQDVAYQKSKLHDFDRKIMNAKYADTRRKYYQQKQIQEDRIKDAEEKSIKQIGALLHDKAIQMQQIEKRYRPVIDFSLIAGQVYSYGVSTCQLTINNNDTQKQITSDFLDPTLSFTVKCEICDNNPDQIHLCLNSHLCCTTCSKHCVKCLRDVCVNCSSVLNPCYICKEGLCSICTGKCVHCSEITCDNHTMMCVHCSDKICYFCSDFCEICSKQFCNKSFKTCHACEKRLCQNDSRNCMICNSSFCGLDSNICVICKQIHCKRDSEKCSICEQIYGTTCVMCGTCATCTSLHEVSPNHSSVQEFLLVNPDYSKYKKWESATNDRFSVFKIKKLLGSKIIVYDKTQKKIIVDKKGGWR